MSNMPSGKSPDKISHESLEEILRDWAENLSKINGDSDDFVKKWYPNNDRGLTKSQSLSEKSFILFAHGITYAVGAVSNKAAQKISETKLVNAWRKSVWRNSFQQRYNTFEVILKETLSKSGAESAIAAYPKVAVTPEVVIAAIKFYGYKPKSLDFNVVSDLILRTKGTKPRTPGSPTSPGI